MAETRTIMDEVRPRPAGIRPPVQPGCLSSPTTVASQAAGRHASLVWVPRALAMAWLQPGRGHDGHGAGVATSASERTSTVDAAMVPLVDPFTRLQPSTATPATDSV